MHEFWPSTAAHYVVLTLDSGGSGRAAHERRRAAASCLRCTPGRVPLGSMIISLATFEHLPKRVGGLAEAATSIGESLARDNEVMVFMPSHGIHKTEKDFRVKKYGSHLAAVSSQNRSAIIEIIG